LVSAPILLGLITAFSTAGLWLAMAGFCAFLAHQPARLALGDLKRGKRYPRTDWAFGFALIYLLAAATGLAGAYLTAGPVFLLPLALSAVLGAVQFTYDLNGKSKGLVPEVCGAVALSLLAPTIVVTGGMDWLSAGKLSVILALHALTSISYVQARVHMARGEAVKTGPIVLGQLLAAVMAFAAVATGALGWTIAAAALLLLGRTAWGLSKYHHHVKAQVVGVQEIGYIALVVLAAAFAI
jgi:hypothetical protein